MSKAKFAAAKELINAGQYKEARAILKTIDHPAAREWEQKLDSLSPPEIKIFNRQLVFIIGGIAILALVIVIGLIVIRRSGNNEQNETTSSASFTQYEINVLSSLMVYCESVSGNTKGDCNRWGYTVMDAKKEEAGACYAEFDWITDRENFSLCLLTVGINVLSEAALTEPIKIEELSQNLKTTSALSSYCKDNQSEDFCYVWSIAIYPVHKDMIDQCAIEHPPFEGQLSQFNDCLNSNNLVPDLM